MPIPGLDARRVTPELKLRLKYYWSWIWCFLLGFFSSFVVVVCLFFILSFLFLFYSHILFFLSILWTLPSPSFHPSSHTLTLLPPPVLKSIVLLLSYSFCPLSSTPSPCPHLPLPFYPNMLPHYHSSLHTQHLLTNLLYQLYTTPTPHITSTLHYNNRNIPKYTQDPQNPAASAPLLSFTHPTSWLPF
jgi:hypothetical protein